MNMYDPPNLCRLCAEIKKDCITLSTCDTQNIQLWHKLQYIAPEIIEENDEFPSEICMICSSQLNIVYEYKRNFLQAYDKLKQLRLKTSLCEDVKEELVDPLENIKLEESDNDATKLCDVNIKQEPISILNANASKSHKFLCKTCGKEYSRKSYLNIHIKKHNEDKLVPSEANFNKSEVKFMCKICGKEYTRKSNLAIHIRKHKSSEKLLTQSTTNINSDLSEKIESNLILNEIESDNVILNKNESVLSEITKSGSNINSDLNENVVNIYESKRILNEIESIKVNFTKNETDLVNKYACNICFKSFDTQSYLKTHMMRHDKAKLVHNINESNLSESNNVNFTRNESDSSDLVNKHECNICFKTFDTKSYLKRHMIRHDKAKLVHECTKCSKRFYFNCMLRKHMQLVHSSVAEKKQIERKYVCETCGKKFLNSGNLSSHRKIHSKQFTYQCEHCGKGFHFSGDLKLHIMSHLDDRPFACDLCASKFRQASKLVLHKRVVHEGERPFQCKLCDKAYKHPTILKQHSRIHTNERPHACTLCEKTFQYKVNLKRHFRIHTHERPYRCEICDKGFTQSFNLKVHLRVHNK